MTSRPMMVGPSAEAGQGAPRSEIRAFRLGDYGLIDVAGAWPGLTELRQALLWEWAMSPAGVIIRVDTDQAPDDSTVRCITGDAAALRHAWPGTPIGLLSPNREVRDLVAQDPRGRHLAIGRTLTEIWESLWSPGGKVNFTIELPPTVQAPRTARDVAARACADWNLSALSYPAARLTGDLVARSVVQGANDIHFTVSRHQSRVRLMIRDDVPATGTDNPQAFDDVLGGQLAKAAASGITDSRGEFVLDGHHIRWVVTRAP